MSAPRLLLAAALLAAACSHAQQKLPAEAPVAAAPDAATGEAASPAPAPCAGDGDCAASALCVSGRCVAVAPGLAECRASAHFDFDRADVRPEDQPALQRAARCLAAVPGERAVVEGSCDERGTVQYNIALGFRRAHAAASYVEDLGVAAARLDEVSYGKEKPLCTDSTEACWASNRRADVVPGAAPQDAAAAARPGAASARGRVTPAVHRGDRGAQPTPLENAPTR